MPDDTTQKDIGRLEGQIRGVEVQLASIERLLREQNTQASDSRKALYDRVGRVETAIEVSGKVEAQVRDRIDRLEVKVHDRIEDLAKSVDGQFEAIETTIEAWRDLLRTGRRISIVMGVAGLSLAGVMTGLAAWFGETLPAWVRSWLRLG